MRPYCIVVGIAIACALLTPRSVDAGPITCGVPNGGAATVDGALTCTGTGIPGEAGLGPLPNGLNDLGAFGGGWEFLAGIPGASGTFAGDFTVDPHAFQCLGGGCKEFIVALKWDDTFAFFALGALTDPLLVSWVTTQFELGYATIYGRESDPTALATPEPGTLALLGIGLAAVASRLRRRFSHRPR